MASPELFRIGETFGANWCFSEQQVSDFARMTGDFNPIHHDKAAAAQTSFGKIMLSGTQYTALMMGLVATFVSERSPTLGLEFDFKFKKAVFANESLTAQWVISDIRYHDKLQGNLIHFEGTLINDKGELCTVGRGVLLQKDSI